MDIQAMGIRAQKAARELALADGRARVAALLAMADALEGAQSSLIEVNRAEVEAAVRGGMSQSYVDRLTLTPKRVLDMAAGLRDAAALPDPLAAREEAWVRPNGLKIRRVRVPLGVIGIIYESRPNVTADAAGLCVLSGNACVLRGGSEAIRTNGAIADALRRALKDSGLPQDCVQLLSDPSREKARDMMRLRGLIDVLIPRGGAGLINAVLENASVPVIETGAGVCHTYIDSGCDDFAMARAIVLNAKCQRPSVCNAVETLLVDAAVAPGFLPDCLRALRDEGVELRGCDGVRAIDPQVIAATEEDWRAEYNDMILAIKIVEDMRQALSHIQEYGTRHSECIVTQDGARAQDFLRKVDAAVVYHNASTRFTDGGEFGFGAEIGISNQKLHARGPMGPEQLTTIKYLVDGDGQIR